MSLNISSFNVKSWFFPDSRSKSYLLFYLYHYQNCCFPVSSILCKK